MALAKPSSGLCSGTARIGDVDRLRGGDGQHRLRAIDEERLVAAPVSLDGQTAGLRGVAAVRPAPEALRAPALVGRVRNRTLLGLALLLAVQPARGSAGSRSASRDGGRTPPPSPRPAICSGRSRPRPASDAARRWGSRAAPPASSRTSPPMALMEDAITTLGMACISAASSTFQFESMFTRKTTCSGSVSGSGIAAICTTASAPLKAATISPRSVLSTLMKRTPSWGRPPGPRSSRRSRA